MAEQRNGILDFLSSPLGQGLLSGVATGLAGGGRTATGNIGRGVLGALSGYNGAQDNLLQRQQAEQRTKLFDAQMQGYQTEADARKFTLGQKQDQASYLGSIGKVTSPRLDAQPNKFDARRALSLGLSPEFISTYASADTLGMPKVARTLEGADAQGNKVTNQYDEFARQVGQGLPGYVAPVQVNQGNKISFVRPSAGVSLPVGISPDAAASNALGWANHRLAGQRLAQDQAAPKGQYDAERGVLIDPRTGTAKQITLDGQPLSPKAKSGPMSVTLQKELIESDDGVQASASAISSLKRARALNDSAYSGYGAGLRAKIASNLGNSEAANATVEYDNLIGQQALSSLKTIFGGNPTEGERAILLELQASSDKSPAQRRSIIDRAIKAAEVRGKYATNKSKAIRGGTYLTEGIDLPAADDDGWSIQEVK